MPAPVPPDPAPSPRWPAPNGPVGRALLGLALLAGPRPIAAQLPSDPLFAERRSLRAEFLNHTLSEVRPVLDDWQRLVEKADPGPAAQSLTEDALFMPLDGWIARGRPEIGDSLRAWLPRLSAYGLTLLDFDASSSLVYVLASVHYQVARPPGRRAVQGLALIVLRRDGRQWQIRSYLERPHDP